MRDNRDGTGLGGVQRCKNHRQQRSQMRHSIRWYHKQEYRKREIIDPLLFRQPTVHGKECFVPSGGQPQELSVVDPRPAAARDGVYLVAFQERRKVVREILVK